MYLVPPPALVEVQGYAFQAMTLMASLLRRTSDAKQAEALEAAAHELREHFQQYLWMEEERCYCLTLVRGCRQLSSMTPNAAQVLWTGIPSSEQTSRVATRVMQPDMFSGWGVRTPSADHPAVAGGR